MRVLFVSSPGIGHVFPMIPMAWALRAAGHEVLVATTGDACTPAAHAGLPVVNVRPGFNREALLARMRRERPDELREMLHRRIDDLRQLADRFARMAGILVHGVVALAEQWRPDLIVQSQFQGAGLVAAGKLGIPVVDHGFGFSRTTGMPAALHEHMVDVFRRHDVAALPEHHIIDVAPPSMLADSPEGWSLGYVPYNGGSTLPDWLAEPPSRPRVAVTLGTVAPQTIGVDPVHRIVGLAERVDADFVLALGETDLDQLGTLPANVHPAGWVPLHMLLPSCAALVHHGGAGTTMTALACGVPQLVLPTGADRHINADAVHRRGAGISAETTDVTEEVVGTLIHDDRLRKAAQDVRAEIQGLPRPADLVSRLVTFAARPAAH